MKAALAEMSPEEISSKSYAACETLIGLDEYRNAQVVMLYLPIPQEVDPVEIALHAWQDGKIVLAPKVNWTQRHMLAMRIRSFDDGVVDGQYGIREPEGGEVWPNEEIDLIVIPALAFDNSGGRLGRGGGFYDRFLAEPGTHGIACGLGFDIQVVDELPISEHDHPIDMLVTNKEVLRFKLPDSQHPRE